MHISVSDQERQISHQQLTPTLTKSLAIKAITNTTDIGLPWQRGIATHEKSQTLRRGIQSKY